MQFRPGDEALARGRIDPASGVGTAQVADATLSDNPADRETIENREQSHA